MESYQLDIILPCYNPPPDWVKTISTTVFQLEQTLQEKAIRIILVNDGSDRILTETEIQTLKKQLNAFTYISYQVNQGKGFALRKGVEVSTAAYCIFTDIDFPFTVDSFYEIYKELKSGKCDIAIGVNEESYYQHLPKMRIYLSKILKWMTRTFLRISITDTQRGLKGFNHKGKKIFLSTTINRYLCDLEFIFLADRQKKEIKMNPIVVYLKKGVVFSELNLRILLKEGISFMKVFFKTFR